MSERRYFWFVIAFVIKLEAQEKGSWNVYYNFDQYFYEPKKASGEGIGVFGRFGASDGDPNFMHFFYSLGIGGKGVIPSREREKVTIGTRHPLWRMAGCTAWPT